MKMRIEVAISAGLNSTQRGELLERLAAEFLSTQNFEVTEQIRLTATELDLLCQHRVNKKVVYVECKAYRENLSANILTNLLGTVTFKQYQEGWLFSTGRLGRDAKGFLHEWETRPVEESQKLSFYTPERILEVLGNSRIIVLPPQQLARETLRNNDLIGEWLLTVTSYGTYWLLTCLEGGVPAGVIAFSAKTGRLIEDTSLLRNLSLTDTSVNSLDFEYILRTRSERLVFRDTFQAINTIEVQHGDNWADYRPARPQDFVGRNDEQEKILSLLESVREGKTSTRVFAITGDSGMGKSSLIAKIRARVGNTRNRSKYFMYAVDVRAAQSGGSYVISALLTCIREALKQGFGDVDPKEIKISDATDPLSSPSLQKYFATLNVQGKVVCLVFDQFEELYSKPELFNVFEEARKLFLSVTHLSINFVLGFAWKTDSTVQQDHPAYYMWHQLTDHRMRLELRRFTSSETSSAITVFEKELSEKLRASLRRQIVESSQGYPWLLKKLSIFLFERIRSGVRQSDIIDRALDVKSLFDSDIQQLTQSELMCLRQIAENAPADWYETLGLFDQDILRSLQDKRLIVRSGDRINIYWDIFREYLLTQTVPSIPLTYLPSSLTCPPRRGPGTMTVPD